MTPIFATLELSDYLIIAWIVLVFTGGAVYAATRQRVDLRRLERKLDVLLKHQGISLPPMVSEEVQRVVNDPAKKFDAIILHQKQTGLGLEDAAADVEAFMTGKL